MDKYILCEQLGSGGSGTVYRAYDMHLKCDRAVKKFSAEEAVWRKEWEVMKGLRHPLLPVITDFIDEGEDKYLVMEYIQGQNLEEYIKEKGHVEQEQAVCWALELADVLIYFHERKNPIIYRDMKPSNIIVDGDGKIHLVDFGTAWLPYREGQECKGAGTYGYAAPEQMSGGWGGGDERSDIYGLGATLYHMLTGDNPSKPPYFMQPIRFFDGRLSAELERVVKKAVEEEQEKRYQTMRQFRWALANYGKGERVKGRLRKAAELSYYISILGLGTAFARLSGQMTHKKETLITAMLILVLCLGKSALCAWQGRGRKGMRQERNILLTEKKGRGLILSVLAAFSLLALSGGIYASAAGKRDAIAWGEGMEGNLAEGEKPEGEGDTEAEKKAEEETEAEEEAWEENGKLLWVEVKNERGQKLLIQYDAVYQMTESLKLELPLSNFEEGEVYRLRLECTNCGTDEKSSRIFYLKGVEP